MSRYDQYIEQCARLSLQFPAMELDQWNNMLLLLFGALLQLTAATPFIFLYNLP